MKTVSILALGVLISAQLAVPFSMIRQREDILSHGELFRFKTRPIDPADPFQGRYVRLGIEMDYIPQDNARNMDVSVKASIYAILETDDDGFARFTAWSKSKPSHGRYLKTRVLGPRSEWNDDTKTSIEKGMRIDIPFDRYYMEETKAPRAEALARDATRHADCWVNVRILNGKAVIEDVFAEGQSLNALAATQE